MSAFFRSNVNGTYSAFFRGSKSEGGGSCPENRLIPPAGGTNQVLAKVSPTDYDVTWQSVGMSSYIHEQSVPSTVWNVNHNLGVKIVFVRCVRYDGSAFFPEITYNDENNLTLTSSIALDGYAYIDGGVSGTNTLPTGGIVGQVLTKNSNLDFDASWKQNQGISIGLALVL